MALSTPLLFLLIQFSVSTESHMWGGSVTFSPKGMYPDGSYKVEFRFKQTSENCTYLTWNNCIKGHCGNQTRLEKGLIYYIKGRNKCQTEGVMTRQIPSDSSFSLSERGCCWVTLANNFQNWTLLTVVNHGKRSDTKKPNRSPVTTSISYVRVPQNCPRIYTLITFDPDNDQARCRYGTRQEDECSGCQLPAGFTLNQTKIKEKDFCTLNYSSAPTGVYGLELVVEDFPRQNISLSYKKGSGSFHQHSSPLSQVPLQFAVIVDPFVESCDDGVYLPKFVHPTPENGEELQAMINQELEILIKPTASATLIYDITISGPLNITADQYDSEQFVIRWTPRSDDLGEYFPICFIAESSKNFSKFQSEMRCVIVKVGNHRENVAGLRMTIESQTPLTEVEIEETVLKQFQEQLIQNGLPNTTSVRLRHVHKISP